MTIITYFILSIYVIALLYITIFCMLQLHLLFYYKRGQSIPEIKEVKNLSPQQTPFPFVTIQLPIFNEMYVVERLIDSIVKFDYPKDRYEIHLLDDSTDETLEISRKKVAEYKAKGFNIDLFHRTDRTGYKAGALKAGMQHAKGEFIAIFDADFLPKSNFLKATIPNFNDEKVGVVQTRWEHINRDYSVLTRMQAMQLNVHFTVEQQGRKSGNCMLQFNGTGGIWRRKCIEDAGGWEADTLTEDLDLSYRAQLKGWEIIYMEKFGSPAELPAEMSGLKSQQFRWMKGGAETARKMLPTVWRSDQLNFKQKMHATGHLMSSGVFIFIFIAGVFSVPLLFLLQTFVFPMNYFAFFFIGTLSIIAVYYVANVQAEISGEPQWQKILKFLLLFPLFLSLSMGLSLHNTIAVLQGYWGRESPFVRTPKFDIKSIKDRLKNQQYLDQKISWTTILEGLLCLYFLFAIYYGTIVLEDFTFMVFHAFLAIGYGTIFYYSVRHVKG